MEQPLALIRRAQAQDRDAFASLFQLYKNLVYKTAYLMLRDRDEADDALQEIFVRVHREIQTYDPNKGAFTTWLHRVTMNHSLNHLRGAKRAARAAQVPLDVAASIPAPGIAHPADQDVLRQAVDQLSDKQRAVVVLRYFLELSYDEIAQVLDIPLGTVKSRLTLALATLRRALEEDQASCARTTVRLGVNE